MADLATLSIRVDTTGMKDAQKGLEKLSNTGSMVETMAKNLSAAFAAYQVGSWVKDTTLLAARYDTLGVAMNAVGKNAGYTSTVMGFYQKQLQDTGISALEARDTLTMMASAQINLAESSKLARIAQDAAVIGNINSSEAFNRMIQGIRSGQVEILRTIGINVTFEQGYQKLAKSLGKATGDLSDYEKMQSRTNQVMEYGKNIAGAYEAAMGTAGKQLRSMERYYQDFQVQLGAVFQPSLNLMVEDLTKRLKDSTDILQRNKSAANELATAMAEVVRQGSEFMKTINMMNSDNAGIGGGALAKATSALSGVMALARDYLRISHGGSLGALQDALDRKGSATSDWMNRAFAPATRTFADWTQVGMADSEGLEGGDPYGVIRARQMALATEAARKAAEAYAKVLTPLNQALAAEHILYAQGERAAYAFGLTLKGVHKADADALLVKWDTVKSLQAWHKTMEDLTRAEENWKRNHNKPKDVNPDIISSMFGGFQTAHDLADPLRWEKDQILNQRAALDRWKDTMPIEDYTRALETLRLKDLQLRASEGQTWAIIGQTVVQNASLGTDALQRWMNNTDQLGRTWTSLGQTFRSVIHDMVLQMQKAVIQQQLMQPMFNWASKGSNWINLFSGGSVNTGPGTGGPGGSGIGVGMGYPGTLANPAGGSSGASVSVTIYGATGDTKSSVQGGGAMATGLKRVVDGYMAEFVIRESRSGGMLSRT